MEGEGGRRGWRERVEGEGRGEGWRERVDICVPFEFIE